MSFCWSGHVSLSFWSNVSKVTSLKDCSWRVFSKCHCHCLCLCNCLCHCLGISHCLCHYHCLIIGQVMSLYHSDQMSLRSQICRVALWWCSQNIFVIVLAFVIVFVFVIVFLSVKSCLLVTLIKCHKVQNSLRVFSGIVFNNGHLLNILTYSHLTRSPIELSGDS